MFAVYPPVYICPPPRRFDTYALSLDALPVAAADDDDNDDDDDCSKVEKTTRPQSNSRGLITLASNSAGDERGRIP
jgi:hypothetical protein